MVSKSLTQSSGQIIRGLFDYLRKPAINTVNVSFPVISTTSKFNTLLISYAHFEKAAFDPSRLLCWYRFIDSLPLRKALLEYQM